MTAPTPGPAPVCACDDRSAGAAEALEAVRAGPVVLGLIDEPHLIVQLRRCRCGRAWLSIFTERIDWVNGDDPQRREYYPLGEPEVVRVLARAAEGPVDEAFLLRLGAGPHRRVLVRDWPGGAAAPEVKWGWGIVSIAGHD